MQAAPHALTQYAALYESLKSRRLRPTLPKGLDKLAARARMWGASVATRRSRLTEDSRACEAMGQEFRSMSEAALDDAVARIREVFVRGRAEREDVRRGLASVREVARRLTGEEAYPVQLLGALALYHGRVIEMLTGEGKTLTGSLAAPLLAWRHRRVHVFTVNDYLAKRDAQSRRAIFRRCLLDGGAITQEMEPGERAEIYALPVVFGTPKQITADWLRDQIKLGRADTAWAARGQLSVSGIMGGGEGDAGGRPIVPGLRAAMVDEADAVLIDEGVVPLIIARSRREDDMARVYREAAAMANRLDEHADFEVDLKHRRIELTRRGRDRMEPMFERALSMGGAPIWKATRRGEELVKQALTARHCYIHGQHYQIVEGKVVIVDEYTGRFLADRSWEHGLHQAVEAKEGLEVTADRETLARMSFQRFFRSYPFLCGMTGTVADATSEIEAVYARPVMVVPTHRPIARVQMPLRVFGTSREKWAAIAESIEEIHRLGRPILVGTRSIAASEILSRVLTQRGLEHRVLNAHHDKDEATMIESAGKGGGQAAITVATNMAGRGTDIKCDKAALAVGGLHVLLTEMHGAKRIDRQFIGRAGRQGDPGSAQIFVSYEDELVQRFVPRVAAALASRMAGPEASGTGVVGRVFRYAQSRSEARDRRNRSSVLRQDDWIDKNLPGIG